MKDKSGRDLDIWGDGSQTNSTPIPEEWMHHRDTESTEKSETTKDTKDDDRF